MEEKRGYGRPGGRGMKTHLRKVGRYRGETAHLRMVGKVVSVFVWIRVDAEGAYAEYL